MGDLLDVDYSQVSDFTLHGIDLDPEALELASALARQKGLLDHCAFSCSDAWNLEIENQFDLLTSNGLTIYETDDEKVVELYRQFYRALKPEGYLITSFVTAPPVPGMKTEWDLKKVNTEDALRQKIIFADILEGNWQVFRSEESVKEQLKIAGFDEIEILYDDAHIMPTAIAKKPAQKSNDLSQGREMSYTVETEKREIFHWA